LLFGFGASGSIGTLLFGFGASGSMGTFDAKDMAISAAITKNNVMSTDRNRFMVRFDIQISVI
jgi:hypothetical protein